MRSGMKANMRRRRRKRRLSSVARAIRLVVCVLALLLIGLSTALLLMDVQDLSSLPSFSTIGIDVSGFP
jgi:hypothetical protein